MMLGKISILVVVLTGAALGQAQGTPDDDPFIARKAELEQRFQQAYERILAEQTEPPATTAEEVIERCLEASGGREAWAAVRTMVKTVDGHEMAGGFGGTFYLKAPNFIRLDHGQGRAFVTDGVSAWTVEEDRWQPVISDNPAGQRWRQMFSISLDLIDFAAKNVTYEFIGTEALEGSACYKLRKDIGTGKEIYVYFNIETGLLMMEEEFGDDGWMANLFYDYREISGVRLPHLRVRVADLIKTAHVGLLSYMINEPLDESLFVQP